MTRPKFKAMSRAQGNNQAVKDGTVRPASFDFDWEEVPVLVKAFRRMVRGLEFDICEMALTTYICAREHGVRFTALPIFLVRGFHHAAIFRNKQAGISGPKDLEGRKMGVNRGYTVTTGVWARGTLQEEYGVDLDKITWVLSGDEHVADYRPPANVVPLAEGETLEGMLESGELAGAVGALEHPLLEPLIPDPVSAGMAALKNSGVFPINHLVVVRDDVLAANPHIAAETFEAFAESKRLYVEALKAGRIAEPTAIDKLHSRVMEATGADPLPYGVEASRPTLEKLIDHALGQGIITKRVSVESLFAQSTLGLVG